MVKRSAVLFFGDGVYPLLQPDPLTTKTKVESNHNRDVWIMYVLKALGKNLGEKKRHFRKLNQGKALARKRD